MSLHIYPVVQLEDICNDYRVRINGQEAPLNTARVSAYPINRRWPGHQRPKDQTELINFLSIAADEILNIEVLPADPFHEVTIRPLGTVNQPEISPDGWIRFQIEKPGFYTVEPFGRHHALHLFIDAPMEYNINLSDENVLYFGPGTHEAGTIHMKDNQTLYLAEGAVVFGSIVAYNVNNIKILGHGILDNSHNKETILYETSVDNNDAAIDNAIRTHTVQLEYCDGITINGITIRDSLVYAIRPIACKNLEFSNIKVIGSWRYNSDGIDMHNCENVHISDCFVRTYDDCICIKGFDCWQNEADMYKDGKSYDVFKNVVVENCTIWNDWGKCLEIGAETRAKEISNIIFRNCHVIHATGDVLDCMNVDYADIYNVTYENITVEFDDTMYQPIIQKTDADVYQNPNPDFAPFLLRAEVVFHHEYSGGGLIRGKIHDFQFKNIHLIGRHMPKFYFTGYDETHKCNNITISDLYWNSKKLTEAPEGSFTFGEHCENITLI